MDLDENIKTTTKDILLKEFNDISKDVKKELLARIEKEKEEEYYSKGDKLKTDPLKGIVAPSTQVIDNVCKRAKICDEQGPITFGQLELLIKSAQKKKFGIHMGEGVYKSFIRLLPWFMPQIAIVAFVGAGLRAMNKVVKPALETTKGYKRWWGKVVTNVMDVFEGELPISDPFSKIFFISDGTLEMLNEKSKIKFVRYISEVAASKPRNEVVPEYYVENELRKWLNQKYLLTPPLKLMK